MSLSPLRACCARLCSIAFVVLIALPSSAPFPAVSGDETIAITTRTTLAAPVQRSARNAVACNYQHAVPSARASQGRPRVRGKSAGPSSCAAAEGGIVPAGTPRLPPHRPSRSLDRQLIVLRI